MRQIMRDLEARRWAVHSRSLDGKTVLFLTFSEPILTLAVIRQIRRIVANRADVKRISVGSLHTIIISN